MEKNSFNVTKRSPPLRRREADVEKLGNHGDFSCCFPGSFTLCPPSDRALEGGGAMVSNSQRGAGRKASLRSPQAKHLLHKDLEVPCPQICPLLGQESAEQPAAVSFHLRGRPRWAGCRGEGAG